MAMLPGPTSYKPEAVETRRVPVGLLIGLLLALIALAISLAPNIP